jgi:putative toxin-antitoxin system antitoxin component (TIGR02293 family)
MSVTAKAVAEVLGFPESTRPKTWMEISKRLEAGLPTRVVISVSRRVAPDDRVFQYRFVPKPTLARRVKSKRLSAEEGGKVVRVARVWALAVETWGSDDKARAFLNRPHPLLGGALPIDAVFATEVGAREVEDILGRLHYGTAA